MVDKESLASWIGRTQEQRSEVSHVLAQRLGALLDKSTTFAGGDALPPHWYGILFGETALQSTLAQDGHPAKGDFLPPVPFPRRMFAGKRVRFVGELPLGEAVSKTSTIQSIEFKEGRSGPMCFVTVRHDISGRGGVALIEEQDIVYRQAAAKEAAPSAPAPAREPDTPPGVVLAETVITPDETMLFRYSAITFNAHRIHYDAAYARDVERYPGLVVNGGLTLLLMWQFAHDQGLRFVASDSRNRRPVFAGRPLRLQLLDDGAKGKSLVALDAQGEVAIQARLEVAA